jgi:hypothetical protein
MSAATAPSAIPDSPAPFSAVTAAHATVPVTAAISAARDLPDLVNKLQAADPQLAEQLEGKSLVASKTPLGTFVVPAVVWVSAHYALGWDATTCSMIAGALVLIGTYAMRYVTTSPIAGLFSKGASPAQVAAVPAAAKSAA